MLFKPDELELRSGEDRAVFIQHYEQMLAIRLGYRSSTAPGLTPSQVWIPYCHHVAHAYARAFGVGVVDGEKVIVRKVRTHWFGRFISASVVRYAHSWNVVTMPSGKRVIFDLFPNESCSMLPIVTVEPNPAYTKHWDGLAEKGVIELFLEPHQAERLEHLVEQFREIVART